MAPDPESGGTPSEGPPTNDPTAAEVAAQAKAEERAAAKVAAQPTPPVESEPEVNTSGRPDLADVAQERVENRNPTVIVTGEEV